MSYCLTLELLTLQPMCSMHPVTQSVDTLSLKIDEDHNFLISFIHVRTLIFQFLSLCEIDEKHNFYTFFCGIIFVLFNCTSWCFFVSRESNSTITNVHLFVCLQNPSTSQNHHPSSFFIILHLSLIHFATFKLFSLFLDVIASQGVGPVSQSVIITSRSLKMESRI